MVSSPPPHSIKELNRLHVSGKYVELIQAARENLAHIIRECGGNDQRVADEIQYLAWWLYENGDFAAAEDELRSGMVFDTRGRDDLKDRNAACLLALANIYLATGREPDASSALKQANELMAGMSDVRPIRRAVFLLHSARILTKHGDFNGAEQQLKQASDLAFSDPTPKDRIPGIILHRLSQIYDAQGRLSKAEDTLRKAMEVYPARETAYYANSLSLLALYLAKKGNMSEALSSQIKSLEILRRVRPAGHRDITAAEHRLAAIQRPEDNVGSPS
jgi:tetratricopeptide (TPR) repeat protein